MFRDDKERQVREATFSLLQPGMLISILSSVEGKNVKRFFITVTKDDEGTWRVIELSPPNNRNIISSCACIVVTLKFEEMCLLAIRSQM